MALPNVYEEIKDGGLGLIAPANAGVFGIVGNASQGNNEEIYILNDPATAEDTFEAGTLLERILDAFGNGATKILVVKADPTDGTAASYTDPTAGSGNSGTGTVVKPTTPGTPNSDRDFKIVITDGGVDGSLAAGGVKIKISQNGGLTYGDDITLASSSPQTIDLGNGTTVEFTDNETPEGSFVKDDYWTLSSTEAKPTTQKVLDAVEVLGENDEVAWIHVSDATDETFWASISTYNAELEAKHKYIYFVMESDRPTDSETTDQWITTLQTASSLYFEKRVMVCAGWGLLTDRNGEALIRNGAGIVDGLTARAKVQESIGWVRGFKVNNMLSLYPTDLTEAQIDTLDQARYATFRFWPGHGYRVTNGRMMATQTSDYRYLETLRVVNKAVKLVRSAAVPFVQAVADAAGLIAYQKSLENPLEQMKTDNEIVGYELLIPAGQDVTSTGEVLAQLTVIPVPIMRKLTIVFGLGKPKAA